MKFRPTWPRSFGSKITLLTTLISAAAIVAVSLTLAALQYAALRQKTLAALQTQTHLVAMNSAAPLAFADAHSAAEALAAFESLPSVASAVLRDNTAQPFAHYRRSTGRTPDPAVDSSPTLLGEGWHTERAAVVQQGQPLGSLVVVYDMRDLRDAFWSALSLSLMVSVIAVLLVLATTLRVRRVLLGPIAALHLTARNVSRTKDYGHRAPKMSDDEIGEFADAFNQMLEQIQAQDRAIQESRADALRANQLKDEFLATLSHELRTPMAPIIGWAQILKLSARDPEKVAQAAVVIERNARAQNKIIEDLLDMSRIVSGKIKLEPRNIDVADVIDAALDTVAATAGNKGVKLAKHVPHAIGRLRADPNRLQQVVWNLLNNAIKFTPAGGTVEITLRRRSGHAEIAVQDSGEGIAPAFLPHIFERFRQADSTSTRPHAGLGLGLAIAKQLVELHGGSIAAESGGIGRGARFIVCLPIVGQVPLDTGASAETTRSDDAPLHGLRVLLVDDESDTRELIREVLAASGASVRACDSAGAALGALPDFRPDVLVSDIAMPEMNGYDLIGNIRGNESAFRDMPAIALTAFARDEDRRRALDAGFQEHVSKPVDNAALVAVVGRIASHAVRAAE